MNQTKKGKMVIRQWAGEGQQKNILVKEKGFNHKQDPAESNLMRRSKN